MCVCVCVCVCARACVFLFTRPSLYKLDVAEGGLITAIRNDTDNMIDDRMTIPRIEKWKKKPTL